MVLPNEQGLVALVKFDRVDYDLDGLRVGSALCSGRLAAGQQLPNFLYSRTLGDTGAKRFIDDGYCGDRLLSLAN